MKNNWGNQSRKPRGLAIVLVPIRVWTIFQKCCWQNLIIGWQTLVGSIGLRTIGGESALLSINKEVWHTASNSWLLAPIHVRTRFSLFAQMTRFYEKQWWSKRNNGGVKEVRHWWEPPSEKLSPLPVKLPWSWKIWHIIYLTSSAHLAAWQPCSASAHLRPVALVALALRLAVPVKMSDHWRGPRWRINFQPFAIYAGINCNLWRYSESCWTFRTCLWVWTALPKIIGWEKHIK